MKKYERTLSQCLASVPAVISMGYGLMHNLPDAVHRHYGFPFTWAVHELVAISGPVDVWRVNIGNMVLDLIFWFATTITIPAIYEFLRGNPRNEY
jgi:hypothetical protein